MICPQCGAKQVSAGPRTSPASESAAPEWHDGFARHARKEWNPAAFSFSGVPRDSEYELRDEAPAAQRSWLPFYAIGSVVSIAFLLTAFVVSHRAEREPAQGAQIVEGAILGPKASSAVQDTNPHAVLHAARSASPGAIAQLPPAMTAQAPLPRTAVAHTATVPPGVAARKSSAEERALAAAKIKAERANEEKANAAKASAYARADVSRNLASARASLDKNSLGPARSAINAALAEQPGNGTALQMQAELTSREDQRDSLLGYARLCARDGRWLCAWHNAGHALTVDSSSGEAREILSRSIAAQGAGAAPTMRQVDSGPPGPPIDPN